MSRGIGLLQRRILWLIADEGTDATPQAWDAEELTEMLNDVSACRYEGAGSADRVPV